MKSLRFWGVNNLSKVSWWARCKIRLSGSRVCEPIHQGHCLCHQTGTNRGQEVCLGWHWERDRSRTSSPAISPQTHGPIFYCRRACLWEKSGCPDCSISATHWLIMLRWKERIMFSTVPHAGHCPEARPCDLDQLPKEIRLAHHFLFVDIIVKWSSSFTELWDLNSNPLSPSLL